MRRPPVRVPAGLRFIHGASATRFELAVVYAAGLAAAILVLVFAWSRVAQFPAWKAVILFVLAADVSAGAAAGFCAPTGAWYAQHPGFRRAFPFLNFFQPALLCALFDGRVAYWAFLYGFTAAAASVVMLIRGRSRQEPAAAALTALGTVILLPIGLATPFLAWFAPVYMVKLILGFSIDRS